MIRCLFSRLILRNLKRNRGVYLVYVNFDFENILDTLITISNRINKQRKSSFKQSLARKIYLLRFFSSDPFEMSFYNYYIRLGFLLYMVSPLDSSCCVECIRKNRSSCDIIGVSFKQLLTISTQHLHTEVELEEIEECVVRLRKQKKI